jgi:CRISP-associated protein Cas1
MQFQRSEFVWPGRHKHPAPDPLNALLSLGYTLIMNEISALAQGHGLDPGLGFYHELDGSRPSLALDLMEPFRALIVDRFVLTYANRQQCRAEDFDRRGESQGLFLKPDALRQFFEAYERWMLQGVGRAEEGKVTLRIALRREVNRFADFLLRRRKESIPWQPLLARELWAVETEGPEQLEESKGKEATDAVAG